MRTIRLFVVPIMGLLGATMAVPAANAQVETLYFCTDGGNWGTLTGNWFTSFDGSTCSSQAGDFPDNDDHVIIIPNVDCTMNQSGADAGDLDVRTGATLTIQSGKALAIWGADTDEVSDLTGTIYLASGANDSTLQFTNGDHEVLGAGTIVGQGSNAVIQLGQNVAFTNDATIEGIVTIRVASFNNGQFFNEGTVNANGSGVILLDVDLIEDDASGLWRVSAAGATLRFASQDTDTAAALDGDFTVEAGTLDVNGAGFDTTGLLTFTGGTIDCAGLTGSFVAKFTGSP